ncbi:hypothetical protein SSYRP_v1c04900 [Spiroplasma syrphidicola EA-1]|uniref:Uncharacterized protein n=1 Tax=Spiroplasma syrphidicola EA-1 TaxID=1276229 RepID=R4U3S9_9MOLU|nr:hypothetical protein [Spiroplasma syrphidicola]AGM26082.1 hypothetical protein SSYRP_v1c04900 [Spiroplasma syrphidicola EA-1]
MKKDMIVLKIPEFISLEPEENIRNVKANAEYQFDYGSWKTIVYSSNKIKFIFRYMQGIFKWLSDVVSLDDFIISISAIDSDKFNISLFKNDIHLLNCNLATGFYLIAESEWADRITEHHSSSFDIVDNNLIHNTIETNQWKGEEGFGKFVSLILMLTRDFDGIDLNELPIQWMIEFKDGKLAMSRIRMQIQSLQNRNRPENMLLSEEEEINNLNEEGIDFSKRPNLNVNDQPIEEPTWNKYYDKK